MEGIPTNIPPILQTQNSKSFTFDSRHITEGTVPFVRQILLQLAFRTFDDDTRYRHNISGIDDSITICIAN